MKNKLLAFVFASLCAYAQEVRGDETPGGEDVPRWTRMCYKPDLGLTEYLWTDVTKWFSDPDSTDPLGYMPSLNDDVLLWSSKNSTVPLTIGEGVNAETRKLNLVIGDYRARDQSLYVAPGGTMTNAGAVTVGASGNGNAHAGHIRIGGEWNTLGTPFKLGNSPTTSTLTIDPGGIFINTNIWPVNGSVDDNHVSAMLIGTAKSDADVIVTNKGEMSVIDLHFGSGNGKSRGIIENYGTLNVMRKLTIGRHESSYGRLTLHPGSTLNKNYMHVKQVLLGFGKKSEGVLEIATDVTLKPNDYILVANGESSAGTLKLTDGTLNLSGGSGYISVGTGMSSAGLLELNGDSAINFSSNAKLSTCAYEGAFAHVILRDASKLDGMKIDPIPVANNSTGIVEVSGSAVITNVSGRTIRIAETAGSLARFVVADDAVVGSLTNFSVAASSACGTGTLEMRGGTVALMGGGAGAYQLYVGNREHTQVNGRIRGWGYFDRVNASNGYMLRLEPFGQFIADGEGVERDLDFSQFRTVGYNSIGAQNITGSNGWFAVSKGRLVYPRIQNISGSSHRAIGDYPNLNGKNVSLVNSLFFKMKTYPTGDYHAYTELYAPDRTDIPQGLPKTDKTSVKGVWRLAFSGGGIPAVPPSPKSFSSLTLQIRYDDSGLGENDRIDVYHHDGTAGGTWQRVMKTKVFNPEDPYVTTETPVDPSSETWNGGWFAVTARPISKGLTITIR